MKLLALRSVCRIAQFVAYNVYMRNSDDRGSHNPWYEAARLAYGFSDDIIVIRSFKFIEPSDC